MNVKDIKNLEGLAHKLLKYTELSEQLETIKTIDIEKDYFLAHKYKCLCITNEASKKVISILIEDTKKRLKEIEDELISL